MEAVAEKELKYFNEGRKGTMKALITGVTGFVGSHLADYLLDEQNIEVHGVKRHRSREEFVRKDVIYHEGDITDQVAMNRIVEEVEPNYIFHLAAQSFVPGSWEYPLATLQCNVIGTACVLEAARKFGDSCIVHVAGTSEEYGFVLPEEAPITEEQPLRPFSPYGVSKVATDLLAQQYCKSYGLRTVVTRAFNHTGPRRGEFFICSKIAKRLALVKLDKKPPILTLGNLDAVRDFTDVSRDMARAYWAAVNNCSYGKPYNVGSGTGLTIGRVVETFLEVFHDEERHFTIEQDPNMMRPSDVPYLLCDSTLFRTTTGWKPEIPFKQTVKDLLNYWVERSK